MKLFHKVLFITLCMFSFQMHAQESKIIEPKCPSKATHYLTHLGTDLASRVALITCVAAGITISIMANNAQVDTRLAHTFGLIEPPYLNENIYLMMVTDLTAPMISALCGLFLMYKTPEWADKYLLKNGLKRTQKQNLLTFLHRVFLPYPICTMTGEYCNTGDYLV